MFPAQGRRTWWSPSLWLSTRRPAAFQRGGAVLVIGLLLATGFPGFIQLPAARGSDGATGRRGALIAATLPAVVGQVGGLLAGPGKAKAQLTAQELRQVQLFYRSSPSVVGLSEAPKKGGGNPAISGSAFVWDKDHIVTNFHVIAQMKSPYVTFLTEDEKGGNLHSTLATSLVGADPSSDLAILKVPNVVLLADEIGGYSLMNTSKLMRPLQRGSSRAVAPGQEVFALGNPYGLEHSMSRGVISGVSRTMKSIAGRPISDVIQTDASINPGNSGGPLLDSEGRVIGINSAILSASGSFAGVGLAIPIDMVEHHVKSMLQKGYVSRASLGVTFAPVSMSQALGINGVMVTSVIPGGPASKAGFRAMRKGRLGDVIVGIEGKRVNVLADVLKMLDQYSPGRTINVKLQRASADLDSDGYDYVDVSVQLGALDSPRVEA